MRSIFIKNQIVSFRLPDFGLEFKETIIPKDVWEECSDELLKLGVTPKIIALTDGLDPDEYIIKYGNEFKNLIKNTTNVMDFKLDYLKRGKNLNNTVEEAKYVNEAIQEVKKIDDDILKELTIKKIAEETDLEKNKANY